MARSGPPSSRSSRGNAAKNKVVIPRAEILVRNTQAHSKCVKVFFLEECLSAKGKKSQSVDLITNDLHQFLCL